MDGTRQGEGLEIFEEVDLREIFYDERSLIIAVSALVTILLIKGGNKLYTYSSYGMELKDPYGDNCFSNLIVNKSDGERFSSGVCSCNEKDSFRSFAAQGDSIIKLPGSNKIIIKKQNGESKEFDFPFCED